ncbi:MAG TPA: PQQ-dependent dehydrogenase, methanol/ethanol family [Thermoanaerobaculia bacterium]|nr:PQQ-dependent dehydrogenase, methanol/ethanol family [Thermoanaerobaculia bacterium]
MNSPVARDAFVRFARAVPSPFLVGWILATAACAPRTSPSEDADPVAGVRAATETVDGARIAAADSEPGNWLAHGRTYGEERFSPLDRIDASNVGRLGLAWHYDTGRDRGHEASPIVVDGVMFLTTAWSEVHALDAATGEPLWKYDPKVPGDVGRWACCDVVNRGAAVWKGKVYVGALDGRLIALDAATGEVAWEVATTDPAKRYTITGAPRVVKDKVIIGNGGAEYGVRGYVTAYDAATGTQAWRFYTVPGNPAEPFEHPELERAAATWTGEWWTVGGGGTAWDSMAYDPELDLLYVGTGNGSPWTRVHRSPGGGDNLYLSSILALRPDDGRLVWHYQTTPGDNWDYTATQHIVLADLEIGGRERKVLMQAPKNGFFYVLDRETGELLSAEKYVQVTWASHVDLATGRPVELAAGTYEDAPSLVFPGPSGGHNWHPMAWSPLTGLVYIPAREMALTYPLAADFEYDERVWNTGLDFARYTELVLESPEPAPVGKLIAWDPAKGAAAWTVEQPAAFNGGVLATAGNLVFQGTPDGRLVAFAADSGEVLWEAETSIGIIAPPISYTVDGEQYIAVLAGWGGNTIVGMDAAVAVAITHVNRGRMLAWKLGGRHPMPAVPERDTEIPEPPPLTAEVAVVDQGRILFNTNCGLCHGLLAVSSGVVSDLRYASAETHESWEEIVRGGSHRGQGMASFRDLLSSEEAEAIRAYVISRALEDRAVEGTTDSGGM